MNSYYDSILATCHCKRCVARRDRQLSRPTLLQALLTLAGAIAFPLVCLALAVAFGV